MMKATVEKALVDLRTQFAGHQISVEEDGGGGAFFVIDGVDVGSGFTPRITWLGGHITAAFPFADIYPMYMDGGLRRTGGQAFTPPVVQIPGWRGRPALQVSRINRSAASAPQSPTFKVNRVLEFLRGYQ